MDAIPERCAACGAPRDAVDRFCRVCGTEFDGAPARSGILGRAVRAIVGGIAGVALLYVGLRLVTDRVGDPVQALVEIVVGAVCLGLGGLAVAFAISLVIPPRSRSRRSREP